MISDVENIKVKRNLTALVEFSRIINSNLDLNFILNNLLLTCMGKFLATRGLIILETDKFLEIKSSKGISAELLKQFPKINAEEFSIEDQNFKQFTSKLNLPAVEKINCSENCIGIICLGEKLNRTPYSEDDQDFLRTILNIAATAIQNSIVLNEIKLVNRALDSRVQRLSSLFELSKEFGLFSESTKVAKLLVYSLIGQFLVSKYALITIDDQFVQILESKFSSSELQSKLDEIKLSKIDSYLDRKNIEENFPLLYEAGVELAVPMQVQGKTKGMILLGKRINNQAYSVDDIEFIYSIGSLAIISLENRKLFKQALEKQKMEEELEIAREIQQNLLPAQIPDLINFEISAVNISSKQVGGDYYDIIKLDDTRCCIAIADVSGKGFPAALLMANMQAFLQVVCRQDYPLDQATQIINDLVTENTSDGKFITFFWGLLDDKGKKISYVNAGHNPPLLIRKNEIKKLEAGGMILGVMKTIMPYNTETIELQKNDVLVLFTDGISEAMNAKGEEFSDLKLEEYVKEISHLSSVEILDKIKTEVQTFTKGAVQSDDITLMIIKVK
ncbi:MAG TPA: SpoIIE family protein phosphatase [Ignavibacteriaceae bacterium]|nr:SpoIIE family protein phosphatase [Ignavibacteriaceae bacterium]